jgi:DNA invertase Pin-like site-specific DNA recombinase
MSEKIRPQHLARKAILYVRQSSTYQVSHNLESPKLQYAMQQRLRQLGWREVEIVDEDLGRSAAGTVTRAGFERMVAEVCLGHVGAVAAREVSRFARNSREWQQLVEVCRVVDTVLIDQEMVYAPRQSNDRLLLGLKGSLNEYELDLLRQRSVEARREKARRGELIVAAPIGYLKSEDGRLQKDPDRRVQQAVLCVFEKFLELKTIRQSLLWFLEHGLELPVQYANGEIRWRRPRYVMLYRMLTHPAYGGAYSYGKTQQTMHYGQTGHRQSRQRKPQDEWLALLPNAHEGYVSWEQFQSIQHMISENLHVRKRTRVSRHGQALLAGMLRCCRCGHKLNVRYTGRLGDVLSYMCCRGWLDHGLPRCIAFGGGVVDQAVARELLRVVQPAAVEAAILASKDEARKRDHALETLERDLQAARYAASRAQKQYDATDPENRLVADELERRWNQALQRVRQLETRIEQHTQHQNLHEVPEPDQFESLAADLEALWQHPEADALLKKRIVRTLIHEVVVDVDANAGEVIMVIHWKGGVHTELRVPRRRRGQNSLHTPADTVQAVRVLARTCTDDVIAGVLNRNGQLTGRGNRWTCERVAALRSHHHIAVYRPQQDAAEEWMTLTAAAKFVGLSAQTLRLAVERRELDADHPLPEGPWIFRRSNLQTEAVQRLVERVRRASHHPASPSTQQGTLNLSGT